MNSIIFQARWKCNLEILLASISSFELLHNDIKDFLHWVVLTCPAGFGFKRCLRRPQVPTVIWGHGCLSWAIGTTCTSSHLSEPPAGCMLDYILLKAKWEIFHTLSMTNMFYPCIVKFQLQIVWTWGITHNLKKRQRHCNIFFYLFCCLSSDCQEVGGSYLDFSLKLREVVCVCLPEHFLKHSSWRDNLWATQLAWNSAAKLFVSCIPCIHCVLVS